MCTNCPYTPPCLKGVSVIMPRICDYVVTWQRGNQVADGITVARALTLRCGDYPGLEDGPNVITRIPKSVRGRHKGENKRDDNMKGLGLTLLAVKWTTRL